MRHGANEKCCLIIWSVTVADNDNIIGTGSLQPNVVLLHCNF